MGADFIACTTAVPQCAHRDYSDLEGAPLEAIRKRIQGSVTNKLLMDAEEECFMEVGYFTESDGDEPEERSDARAQEVVLAQLGEMLDHYREYLVTRCNGTEVLLTGGLSWGDEPTEVSSLVSFFGVMGLFEERFYCEEMGCSKGASEVPGPWAVVALSGAGMLETVPSYAKAVARAQELGGGFIQPVYDPEFRQEVAVV